MRIAALWLPMILILLLTGRQSVATEKGKELKLGFGSVAVIVPTGATVDFEPGFEMEWYRIVHPDRRRFRHLLAAVTAGDFQIVPSPPIKRICINGLLGISGTDGDARLIVLELPKSTEMYRAIFEFDDRDADLWRIVRSIAVQGERGTCTVGSGSAPALQEKRWQSLGDGSLQIRLDRDWTLQKHVSFESETYTISRGNGNLFRLYLGNNPDLREISSLAQARRIMNGIRARQYSREGTVTDIVLTPSCGHDTFVWETRLSVGASRSRDILGAMRSVRCTK